MQNSKHMFSFFYKGLSQLDEGMHVIEDDVLLHRLKNVIRAVVGQTIVLFDQQCHAEFVIEKFQGKSKCTGIVSTRQHNHTIKPSITFLLPVLKSEALHETVYNLAESGVTKIQLVSTEKTSAKLSLKHVEKLQKIVHAAAEQSKYYAFPVVRPVVALRDVITNYQESQKFYFDVHGKQFQDWFSVIDDKKEIVLLAGPEGDLTDSEKEMVKQTGFVFCALTKTVLRSVRAISLGATLFRL